MGVGQQRLGNRRLLQTAQLKPDLGLLPGPCNQAGGLAELVLPNLLEWQLPKDSRGRVLAAAEKTGVDDEAHNTCRDINRCYKFTGSR